MRVVFLGTPEVAVPSLEALVASSGIEVVVAITNPDRPHGRGRRPSPPPVKEAAVRLGLEVWQPERPSHVVEELAELAPDAGAVVAYGALLPEAVLATTAHGFVNLHFSLLPRWRGAAPVQHALLAGDEVTGVTTFVLDTGMDTGPILDQVEVGIGPEENAGELLDRLARVGAPLLVESVRRLVAGVPPTPQPAEGATLAPRITPEDRRIDWDEPARHVVNLVRSAAPAPGAHTTFRGSRLKVLRARAEDASGRAGQVVAVGRDGPVIGCGEGAVVLLEVQPQGGRRMPGDAFARGHHPEPGERLGGPEA